VYLITDSVDEYDYEGFDEVTTVPWTLLRMQAAYRQPGQNPKKRVFESMCYFSADEDNLVLGFQRDTRKYPMQQRADDSRGMLKRLTIARGGKNNYHPDS